LKPYSLTQLLNRITTELEQDQRIFDIPVSRFFKADPDLDLSIDVMGHKVATPVGPAAGPHTQMAQNIIMAWLCGSRTFELKTVQILDELEIGRPCIDMETVGYNVEWSQEFKLEQSLQQYVMASMAIEYLKQYPPLLKILGDTGNHVFELSVGYDLKGIQSQQVSDFINNLRDAGTEIEKLRAEIPAQFRDHKFNREIVTTATISTFHGCPPDEVEDIVKHLMVDHGLDVTVKLNPTLLGFETVSDIVNTQLGYKAIELVPSAFVDDMQMPRAVDLIHELHKYATDIGRQFGIKLTNTLVVNNIRNLLPGELAYMSGAPLHVLAVKLLAILEAKIPHIPIAFSAGVTTENFSATVGLGLSPVTVCSDWLKPGGYANGTKMLKQLQIDMKKAGCKTIEQWVDQCSSAIQYVDELDMQFYHFDNNSKLPKKGDKKLELWDCSSCNLCVAVCPNNAMSRIETPENMQDKLTKKFQYICVTDLCNECGNCETFCIDVGAPFSIKPAYDIDGKIKNPDQLS
jgi:putative selenate reductase